MLNVAFALLRTVRLPVVFGLGLFMAGQVASAATLTGRIRDKDSNSYLLGATVTLRESDRTVASGSGGDFALTNVPPGTYTLVVNYLGYREFSQQVVVRD